MSYRIDAAQKLVVTEGWGVLTDDDVLTHKKALLADPAFDPAFAQLSDIRRVERLAVTPAGVTAMVQHDRANEDRLATHRLALVTDRDEVFGMARMYQLLGGQEGKAVGVFRTIDEALAWLRGSTSRT